MKKETVLCAMLATATCATAQNGKFPTSGVSADSVQTEKDSIKATRARSKLIRRPRFKP